ncbi:TetR/AcrR family transcriptional regulator [Pseudonocardia acaciae]|uniref:TetR/AcrR family transcriptional regulator n=1 Tax=Pseudonocardia acaciae TaxID=551276 RepID=UPI00048F6665|nr:TetR/AcrR family transcriptional regulator [Pseudonocardia acaciae]
MRADARRNYGRLVECAKAAFLERGTGASLEDIARHAGVGIGTLYRHFPSRVALIDAVFREEANTLLGLADGLVDAPEPVDALLTWLRAVIAYHRAYHGLAAVLMASGSDSGALTSSIGPIRRAGGALLGRAQRAGAIRADADIMDVLRLANGIGLAAEKAPDDPDLADRLLRLAMDGLRVRS